MYDYGTIYLLTIELIKASKVFTIDDIKRLFVQVCLKKYWVDYKFWKGYNPWYSSLRGRGHWTLSKTELRNTLNQVRSTIYKLIREGIVKLSFNTWDNVKINQVYYYDNEI